MPVENLLGQENQGHCSCGTGFHDLLSTRKEEPNSPFYDVVAMPTNRCGMQMYEDRTPNSAHLDSVWVPNAQY